MKHIKFFLRAVPGTGILTNEVEYDYAQKINSQTEDRLDLAKLETDHLQSVLDFIAKGGPGEGFTKGAESYEILLIKSDRGFESLVDVVCEYIPTPKDSEVIYPSEGMEFSFKGKKYQIPDVRGEDIFIEELDGEDNFLIDKSHFKTLAKKGWITLVKE